MVRAMNVIEEPENMDVDQATFQNLQDADNMRRDEQMKSLDEFYSRQMEENISLNEARSGARMQDISNTARETEKQQRYGAAASGNVGGSKQAIDKAELGASITRAVGQENVNAQAQLAGDQQAIRGQFQEELSQVYQQNPYYAEAMNSIMQGFDIKSSASQQRFQSQQADAQARSLYGQQMGQIIGNAITLGGQTYGNFMQANTNRAMREHYTPAPATT